MNSPAPPPPPTPPAPAPPPPTTNTSADVTPVGTVQLQGPGLVKVKTVKPLGADGLGVVEQVGIMYLITTIPDPPDPPALAAAGWAPPLGVPPPPPPPPVFAEPAAGATKEVNADAVPV